LAGFAAATALFASLAFLADSRRAPIFNLTALSRDDLFFAAFAALASLALLRFVSTAFLAFSIATAASDLVSSLTSGLI
jgi:hypothetical protein